jgi:hypothetical protein
MVQFCLLCRPVAAEPVIVFVGQVQGQGWIFHEKNMCGVVTANHLLKRSAVSSILVRDRGGTEAQAEQVWELSPERELDVALIKLKGPIVESGCVSSQLSFFEDLSVKLQSVHRGILLFLEGSHKGSIDLQETMEIEIFGVDPINSDKFSIRRTTPRQLFQQQQSGAPIVLRAEDNGVPTVTRVPIGLVIDFDDPGASASAVRFDKIRKLAAPIIDDSGSIAAIEPKSNWAIGMEVTSWRGQTVEQTCPPANALLDQDVLCGWRAGFLPGTSQVCLDVSFPPTMRTISQVRFTATDKFGRELATHSANAYTARIDSFNGEWIPITSLQSSSAEGFTAQINRRSADKLRVCVSSATGGWVELKNLLIVP